MFALFLQVVVVPLPVTVKQDSNELFNIGDFKLNCNPGCNSHVQEAFDVYNEIFFPKGLSTNTTKFPLNINIRSVFYGNSPLDADEYYELNTNSSGVYISTNTLDGVPRAFATLAQLITAPDAEIYTEGKYYLPVVKIQDRPKFPFRQILIDSARHYLPLSTLKREARALSLNKMNVLHIHIIDSQSNAFAAETKPANNMQKAAFTQGKRYLTTKDQLNELAKYARRLGVFLMVEYDMPGHARSWYKADQSIVANCPDGGYESVNPINELTYQYIEAYLSDVFEAVSVYGAYPIIHLGGDEVNHGCWNSDKEIADYMSQRGISTVTLWQEFHKRVVDIINDLNPNTIRQYWQESFENNNDMSGTAIVNFWYGFNKDDAIDQGRNIVRTQGWYLDLNQPGQNRNRWQDSWEDFYANDPAYGISQDKLKLALGGGGCIWGEWVDSQNIDDYIWPRATAIAEVLWTYPSDRSITSELKLRINNLQCKLRQFGVLAGPIMQNAPCPTVDERE